MNWYFQNLRCGLRTAFFLPTPQRFAGSWHALMAIAATTVLTQVLMEFAIEGKGGEIVESCSEYLTGLFSLTLIAAYMIGSLTRQGGRILDIAAAFLNSYYFIFIPYALMLIVFPGKFYSSGLSFFTEELISVWAFLVMFRIVGVTCAASLGKLVIAGLLAAGAAWLLNAQVHFSRIYYVEPPYVPAAPSPIDKLTSEELFDRQENLREKSLEQLTVSRPGHTDIYALTLGTYSYQDVFMRDVNYAVARLKSRMGITNIISMINNKATVGTTPVATSTNLRFYLKALSSHFMQPKEDIALIFLTSHGGAKEGLSVNLGYRVSMLDISPPLLQKILKDSGIQNKVVIISACHSGAFIPFLKDEHTMVITAAAEDKVSFGCSDTSNLTYFTQAYFKDGLSKTTDLEKAFYIAKDVIEKREAAEGITEHSNPQIFVGSKIKDVLRNYTGAAALAGLPDTEAAAEDPKADAQAKADEKLRVGVTEDFENANKWLHTTADQWIANAFYGAGFLLLLFAGVAYQSNPGIFRQGGPKSVGVAHRIFSAAVFRTYLCCLGVIVMLAWIAWCVAEILEWR